MNRNILEPGGSKCIEYEDLSEADKKLYSKFEKEFGDSVEYKEVDAQLRVVNRIQKMPKLTAASNEQDARNMISVIDLIKKKYLSIERKEVYLPPFATEGDPTGSS